MLKLRILYFYSSQHFDTGSPKSLSRIMMSLDSSKFEPLFFATGDGPLIDILTAQGVEVLPGTVDGLSLGRPIQAIKNVIRQVRFLKAHRIDLLHMNEIGWNTDLVLACWLLRIPVCLHLRNIAELYPRNLNTMLASRVIFVSETLKRTTVGAERLGDRAMVIHNFVDVGYYASGHSIRSSLGLADTDRIIGTIAQIQHIKGIDVLLEAMSRCLRVIPDARLLIVGPIGNGEEEFAQKMQERSSHADLAGRVHFLGSRQDIPDLLATLDVFVLSSRNETFGNVVVEAMAARVPVVASHVGGVGEIVVDGVTGTLVESGDAESLSRTLIETLRDSDAARRAADKGYERVIEYFDRSIVMNRLMRVYSVLLAK